MAADFLPAFEFMLSLEGGYVLHKVEHDKGGQTFAGIARAKNPQWVGWGEIDEGRAPPASAVRSFYFAEFWAPMQLALIHDQTVATSLFCAGVNAGWRTAAKLAQLVVGTTPDGVIGPKTAAAINAMDPRLFLALFTLSKIARYRDIVTRDRTQGKFLLGWINRALKESA